MSVAPPVLIKRGPWALLVVTAH